MKILKIHARTVPKNCPSAQYLSKFSLVSAHLKDPKGRKQKNDVFEKKDTQIVLTLTQAERENL